MKATLAAQAHRLGLADADDADIVRPLPIEAPVAIEYNGMGYAVMMATPNALEDFAIGFTLSEGLADSAEAIEAIAIHESQGGWVVRISLPYGALEPVIARARNRVSESSCGLCGIESIEQVLRPLPLVEAHIETSRAAIAHALEQLAENQPLGRATGAMHAAAFCTPQGVILAVAEDVGRHNALDKLLGRLAREGHSPRTGFILLSARCSFELVEKTVRSGCPLLVTISAPTSLAVERAKQAGLALVALARSDSALIFNDPHGIITNMEERHGL
jgi:FdhD protein